MKEYLIMDDGGNLAPEQITNEMLETYETVKDNIKEEYKEIIYQ